MLGLRAVAGTGEEFRCGVYTSKGATGYDLTRLLIGAEGTLALITQATLKLTPKPAANAPDCLAAVFDLVLALDGTLSGEHGIGVAKRDFLSKALDPAALSLMRRIKT